MSLADALPGVIALARAPAGGAERRSADEFARPLELSARTLASRRLVMSGTTVDDVIDAYRRHQLTHG